MSLIRKNHLDIKIAPKGTNQFIHCRGANQSRLVCQFRHTCVYRFQIFCSAEIPEKPLQVLFQIRKTQSNQDKKPAA